MRQLQTILKYFLLLFLLTGCQQALNPVRQTEVHPLFTFSKNSVDVAVHLEVVALDSALLVATFTPTEPTLHLYGLEMPLTGIEGVGRPTQLAVISGAVSVVGQLEANLMATDHYFPTFEQPFPLYPDGPITLTLPVSLPASMPEARDAVFSITYMACSSEGVCKPPVTDNQTSVILPTEIWQ
ncbi:MAG: hypothetical protein GY805_24840 [Chloroflexi bacterium]|nr:hypothetical protein [Chloroflexota bacterium]